MADGQFVAPCDCHQNGTRDSFLRLSSPRGNIRAVHGYWGVFWSDAGNHGERHVSARITFSQFTLARHDLICMEAGPTHNMASLPFASLMCHVSHRERMRS